MIEWMRDIARRYAMNGYLPIPADATEKVPRVAWGDLCDSYVFDKAWKNWLDADVAMILKNLVVVDFDSHGQTPNGRDWYNTLASEYPAIFKGAIIEETQNGGIHAYFRRTIDMPDKEWALPVRIGDALVMVEVKTGKRLAYCYPSKKHGQLAYKLIQGSFETVPVKSLPPLPTVFRFYTVPPAPRKFMMVKTRITDEEREQAFDRIVEAYAPNAGIESKMHAGACGLAGRMAGLGYSRLDIERAMRAYERSGHRKFRKREVDDIVKFGIEHADKSACLPRKR